MKYKALILDVDGTIVPYGSYTGNTIPTQKVITSIQAAQKKVTVCLASGRSFYRMQEALDHLKMQGLVIANDGAVVVDTTTEKIMYEQTISKKDIKIICDALQQRGFSFFIGNHDANTEFTGTLPQKAVNIFTLETLTRKDADALVSELSHLPEVRIGKYRHGVHEMYGIVASHVYATKQHGIFEVAKILGIDTHEIIGVGDGYNDFPLLMACGLKVAMGNAVPELKAIADYIAPSVNEDGVVDVIEKFILN